MAIPNVPQEAKNNLTEIEARTARATDEAKENGHERVSSGVQKMQEVASHVSHKAQDWAVNVANKAQETASAAVDKTNEGIAAVGHRMSAFSNTVREAAPHEGAIGSAATTVADRLQASGHYLEGHDLKDMGKDLTTLVRQYPIQSVLVGFGIGCLLGMASKRR